MTIAIFTDIKLAQEYSDKIHQWLLKNRKDYNAECWSKMEFSADEKVEKWYVKVPEDYSKLNAEIKDEKEKLELPSLTTASIVSKLPDDWKAAAAIEPPKVSFMDTTSYSKAMPQTKKDWWRWIWNRIKEIIKGLFKRAVKK